MNEAYLRIKKVLGFGRDIAGLDRYYTDWAKDYNSDIADQHWVSHEIICDLVQLVARCYANTEVRILDAGCGTGLVGVGLRQRGFSTIDGIDLNHEMVEVARRLGVYRDLRGGIDLNVEGMQKPTEQYDIVASSGTFTHGHAEPAALHFLLNYCQNGGQVIVSTRASYARLANFEEFLRTDAFTSRAELLFCIRDAKYIDEEGAHYWVFRRRAPINIERLSSVEPILRSYLQQ